MSDSAEVEVRIAVAEGIIPREDAAELAQEARRNNRPPLALLKERGQITEQTFQSLRAALETRAKAAPLAPADAHSDTLPPSAGAPTAEPARPRDPADAASDSTISLASPVRGPGDPVFPVAGWDRYTPIRFLGQGGMGKVFLALDLRLRREVAIKFVRGDDPEYVRRLIVEARAQARVSHQHVCKIHEVGEIDGKVYIAMQYIAGTPLNALAGELTVEQKVMVVRGAADGLHEAHRVGIIHRDIKPSNIMVVRDDGGELTPYVMDFGLARAVHDDEATQTGAIVGTPRYMAPEQARGEVARLDRRADVYSLGATLYHLLTGAPPIPGTSLLEVVHNLVTMEPRPLRAIDPDIPVDLEAIVLKCLEKDRSARYDSARAVAEDLGRFLDGDAVLARPAGAWYRLRKRIAKHRRAVAAGAVAFAALAAALGWAIETRREASAREQLVRQFTEQVDRIEAMARYSALSPAHDIRGDQAAIRVRMAQLADEIRQAGDVAAGPGHDALGRGYLALGDDAHARTELEAAWQHNYREPRVAYALALVMGHLYQQNLRAAERIEQKPVREAKLREIEHQYRDPALAYLAASKGAEVPSTEYVAALVAFYEGRYDEALKHVDAIGTGLPWFYEAPELRADILQARALRLRNQGDREHAQSDFAAGRSAYATAAAVGESVPAVYAALGELEYGALVMELYGSGDVAPAFDRVTSATRRALAVMPDHYATLVLEARAYRSLAEYKANHGSPVDELLQKALADAQRAAAIAPDQPQARLEIARIYRQWGDARAAGNRDPGEMLQKAIEISKTIAPADQDIVYYNNLTLIFTNWADYQDQVGADAEANRASAIDACGQAIQLNSQLPEVWINLGINHYKRASAVHAKDVDGDLKQALAALDKASAIDPEHMIPYFYQGQIYKLIAQRARARGHDPAGDLARAVAAYRKGVAINPKIPHFHNGIGLINIDEAQTAWDHGAVPDPLLDQARAEFIQAIRAAPDQGFGYDNDGYALAELAWFQRARSEDPSASVRAASDLLRQAVQRIPDRAGFFSDLAMAYSAQVAYDLDQGRNPEPELELASAAIDKAVERNARDAQVQLYLGVNRSQLARWHATNGQTSTSELEEAIRAFRTALDLDAESIDYRLAFGEHWRAWAAIQRDHGGAVEPAIQHGLEQVDRILSVVPGSPDAHVLRGRLRVLQAQRATGAAQRTYAMQASDDLAQALAVNPALARACASDLALARTLAAEP